MCIRDRSEAVSHHHSCHAPLFEFCPWVHQISWCWFRIVYTNTLVDLVRGHIFEELFCFKHKLWCLVGMKKLHVFVQCIILFSPFCSWIVLFLTSIQASAGSSVIQAFDVLCCWLGSCWSSVSQSSFDFSVFRALQSCRWQRQWQRDKDSFLDLERFSDLLTITDSHLTIR